MSNGKAIAETKASTRFEMLEKNILEAIEIAARIKSKSDQLHNREMGEPDKEGKIESVSETQKLIDETNTLLTIQRETLATLDEVI